MLVDLHVHAGTPKLPLKTALRKAKTLGLDGVAVIGDDALPDLGGAGGEVAVFAGAEVRTDRGHYLVFLPRPQELPPLEQLFGERTNGLWPVRDVVLRARALGGATVAAHPYDQTVQAPGGDILFTLPQVTAVETVNARRTPGVAWAAIEAAETMGLPCVGGSDARTEGDIGRGATLFGHALAGEEALIDALRSAFCWPVEFGEPSATLRRTGGAAGGDRRPRPRRR